MILDKQKLKERVKNQSIKGKGDLQELLREMSKEVIETLMEAEMDLHLGYEKHQQGFNAINNRNGKSKKIVKSQFGEIDIESPRDRDATFKPIIVKKGEKHITAIEEHVISLYGSGMTTRDISSHIDKIYGYSLSSTAVSEMTKKVLDKAKEWNSRPLEDIYPIIFMDAIVFKVRSEGIVKKKAFNVALGIDLEGKKSVLGVSFVETESSKYWLSMINTLKNRGVKDVFIFSVDNLSGISEAIEAVYPKADIQKCMVHQIRNSLKFVSYKKRKEVASDLREIYTAPTEQDGRDALEKVSKKLDKKYPHIAKSWEKNWGELATFFQYSGAMRKLIYTTNTVESLNRVLRKATKTRSLFPSEDSAFKVLYLAIENLEKKWSYPIRNWGEIYSQISIYFEDRM